jgi:adenylosuccinate lyase
VVKIEELLNSIEDKCNEYKDITIISRTHGQPASPTKLGKEFKVFLVRIQEQLKNLKSIPNSAKFSGAVGNFNAHKVAYPKINWKKFAKNFVENKLDLDFSFPTTQIEHYDSFASLSDNCRRINNILLDMCVDIWTYISHDYFKQKIIQDEVGSSAMPHKVNPIDFENAEGNLGIANSFFIFFSNKLTKSRLQRDLSDSTVLRNIGVPFAHVLISFESILKGLNKIYINHDKINQDLEENWIVVSEAIQTILRREGYKNPYEVMKELTRKNSKIDRENLHTFIDKLKINDKIKKELKQISPYNYTGI